MKNIPIALVLMALSVTGCRSIDTGDPAQDAINKAGNVTAARTTLAGFKLFAEARIEKMDSVSKKAAATEALRIAVKTANGLIDDYEEDGTVDGDKAMQLLMIEAINAIVKIAVAESG